MESKEESQSLSLGDLRSAIGISQTPPLSFGDEAAKNEPEASLSSADLLTALGYRVPPVHEPRKAPLPSAQKPAYKPAGAPAGKTMESRRKSSSGRKPKHEKPEQEAPRQTSEHVAAHPSEKKTPKHAEAKAPQPKAESALEADRTKPASRDDSANSIPSSSEEAVTPQQTLPHERNEGEQPTKRLETEREPEMSQWERDLRSAAERIGFGTERPKAPRTQRQPAKQPPSEQWQPPRLESNVLVWRPKSNLKADAPQSQAAPSPVNGQAKPASPEKPEETEVTPMEERKSGRGSAPPPPLSSERTWEGKSESILPSPLPKDETKPIITFIPGKSARPTETESMHHASGRKETEKPDDSVRAAAERILAERITSPLPTVESGESPAPSEKSDAEGGEGGRETKDASPEDPPVDEPEPETIAPSEPTVERNWHLERLRDNLQDRTPFFIAALTTLLIAACICVVAMFPNPPSVDSDADSSAQETPVETVYYLPEATLYSYDILGPDDKSYRITEVAEFGEDGFLERSILTINLGTPEQAEDFLKQAKETHKDALLESGASGNAAMLIVKPSDPNISQDAYTTLRKDTQSNCEIIGN